MGAGSPHPFGKSSIVYRGLQHVVNTVRAKVKDNDHTISQCHAGAVDSGSGNAGAVFTIGDIPTSTTVDVVFNAIASLLGSAVIRRIIGSYVVNVAASVTPYRTGIPACIHGVGISNVNAVLEERSQNSIQQIRLLEVIRLLGRCAIQALRGLHSASAKCRYRRSSACP